MDALSLSELFLTIVIKKAKRSGWTDLKQAKKEPSNIVFPFSEILDTSPEYKSSLDPPVWIKTQIRKKRHCNEVGEGDYIKRNKTTPGKYSELK